MFLALYVALFLKVMNLNLLRRAMAQPWAIHKENLSLLAHLVLKDERPEAREMPQGVVLGGGQKQQAGYIPLEIDGALAIYRDQLPKVADGVTVILCWGVLGRAWTDDEKYWFGAIDVDIISAAIERTAEGATVVLWFRSPGGVITGIPETAQLIRKFSEKRRIFAFTDDLCASAAYWLAAQCPEIHATPTASVGSIGVYIGFYDYTEYLTTNGIKLELFKVGRLKAMGLVGNPLGDEERQYLQDSVEEGYKQFTADVLRNRELDTETMQGQTFNGKAALTANLVDKFWPSASAFLGKV